MQKLDYRIRLILLSIVGGAATVLSYVAIVLARQLVASTPLCPDGVVSGMSPSCTYIGVVLPQYLLIVGAALLIYLLFKKYFKYSFLMSFFALAYMWHLRNVIDWLYSPLNIASGVWIFYVLLFLLGGVLFFLLYLYFVKLKMWLWLKLLLAVVILFPVLPMALLNIERQLYAAFYIG